MGCDFYLYLYVPKFRKDHKIISKFVGNTLAAGCLASFFLVYMYIDYQYDRFYLVKILIIRRPICGILLFLSS